MLFDTEAVLFDLQVEQHHHDVDFHRDIDALSLHPRLNHFALHFAKYAGKIAAAKHLGEMLPVMTDMLIIALATANVTNVKLIEVMPRVEDHLPISLKHLGKLYHEQVYTTLRHANILEAVVVAAGAICGACEKIDHLEDVSFKRVIAQHTGILAAIAITYMAYFDWVPEVLVRDRWKHIESKSRGVCKFEPALA